MSVRYWLALVVLTSATVGCFPKTTTRTYSRSLINTRTEATTELDSIAYAMSERTEGPTLFVTLRSHEQCTTTTTPIYRKLEHSRHESAWVSPTTLASGSALLGAIAVASYLAADDLSPESRGPSDPTPDDYRHAAIAGGATAAVGLVAAGVLALQLSDGERTVGDEPGPSTRQTKACHDRAVARTAVAVRLRASAWSALGTTDDNGTLQLAMNEVPDAALSQEPLELELALEDRTTSFALSSKATAQLREALYKDPASHAARDREAAAVAACRRAVESGQSVDENATLEDVSARREQWRSARAACGTRWSEADDQRVAAFEARIVATEPERLRRGCARAVEAAAQQFADEGSALTDAELDARHADATQRCQGASNAAPQLAALGGKLAAAHRAVARRARLANLDDELAGYLERNDAIALLAAINGEPVARARMQEVEGQAVVNVALSWIAQIERGDSAGARRQLCASRTLIRTLVGAEIWPRLRAELVRRSEPTVGSRIAQAMGRCS